MPTDPSPAQSSRGGDPIVRRGRWAGTGAGLARSLALCQSPLSRSPGPTAGARTRSPHPGQRGASLPPLPAKLCSPGCAPRPPARAPPPGAEPGQAGARGCRARAAGARGQPPALGGARPAGYKASARWSLRLLLAQSISARRSPGARGARASQRGRTHLPAATCARRPPRGKLCGPRAEVGAGATVPAAPRPHRAPARPLTFHGGEQRQQQQRGPQPPQGHGCASRRLGPRRRGAQAARAGARAPGSGGRGERRGAAHTQPPPPRSQQNEPSSPGRTGTRAPPALGTAHLSRGRGGSPARSPPPARAPRPGWPRAAPSSGPQSPQGHPWVARALGRGDPALWDGRDPGFPPRSSGLSRRCGSSR